MRGTKDGFNHLSHSYPQSHSVFMWFLLWLRSGAEKRGLSWSHSFQLLLSLDF